MGAERPGMILMAVSNATFPALSTEILVADDGGADIVILMPIGCWLNSRSLNRLNQSRIAHGACPELKQAVLAATTR
jgi:hypothetical protein